jgi:hypothetical protein
MSYNRMLVGQRVYYIALFYDQNEVDFVDQKTWPKVKVLLHALNILYTPLSWIMN